MCFSNKQTLIGRILSNGRGLWQDWVCAASLRNAQGGGRKEKGKHISQRMILGKYILLICWPTWYLLYVLRVVTCSALDTETLGLERTLQHQKTGILNRHREQKSNLCTPKHTYTINVFCPWLIKREWETNSCFSIIPFSLLWQISVCCLLTFRGMSSQLHIKWYRPQPSFCGNS